MLYIAAVLSLIIGCGAENRVTSRVCAIPSAEASIAPTEMPTAAVLSPAPHPAVPNIKPQAKSPTEAKAKSSGTYRVVTGYTSTKRQTDATPCTAADGTDICARHARGEKICATNAFRLGKQLKVEGLGTCTVADRTNGRYANRVDWYFGSDTTAARRHGRKTLLVTPL